MVNSVWDSLKENLKERVTNPFLGTFLIVWILRNHRVCFALFNFDKEMTLDQKLNFISNHYPKCDFFANLLSCIIITMLVLVSTFIVLLASRYLTDMYEKVGIP